ncbi:MAG: hypothetical protein NUV57_01405 [archaeon]|nr:hypothetical protein [archaeon]
MVSVIEISRISLPVATILASAYVFGEGNNSGAIILFIGGVVFTIIVLYLEHSLFLEKKSRQRMPHLKN